MRPPTPVSEHDGYHFVAVANDTDEWRPVEGKRCRGGAGYHHKACGQPSVLELNRSHWRGIHANWWAFCAEHAYGRWAEDGRVWEWRLRPIGEAL